MSEYGTEKTEAGMTHRARRSPKGNKSAKTERGGKSPRARRSGGGTRAERAGRSSVKKELTDKENKLINAGDGRALREENAALGICPYFKSDRGCDRLSCEGAVFHFPDKAARREFVYQFCAHPVGYKACPLQVTLNHYYERKYSKDV